MTAAIPCPEYISLRQQYKAALQRWGDVLLAQHAGFVNGDVQSTLKYRKNAADERDAANTRLEDHKQSCRSANISAANHKCVSERLA
jgi:hypothetical protein